jgi:hypothetical protein
MYRKPFFSIFFVLMSGLLVVPSHTFGQQGRIGYWKFDESSGTTAIDLAGGDNNGTLANAAQWQPGAGRTGGAVLYDSVEDTGRVEIPTTGMSVSEGTMMVWAKLAEPYPTNRNDASYFFGHTTQPSYANRLQLYMNAADTNLDLGLGDSHTRKTDMITLQTGTWYHVALTWNLGNYVVFINGEQIASGTYTGLTAIYDIMDIGNDGNPTSGNEEAFAGLLDEAQLYNRALSAAEIKAAMAAAPYPFASGPSPKDGVVYPGTWVTLSWRAGDLAASHDVYLGDNFDDVNNATHDSETFRANVAATSLYYVAGFPGYAYPDGLVPGTTYYWRIDEVNEAEPNSPWKGPVWSFSIPPKTAYSPVPADNAEFVPTDATLTWTPGFGAKLHYIVFGDDFDQVSNTEMGAINGSAAYKPGKLKLAKTYYWRVDESDGFNTYKGDVWSFTTEGAVSGPNPSNGAVDVKPTVILTWDAGAVAASHEVYFGTDADAVKNATKTSPQYKGTKTLGDESYDPGELLLETTYYWRIDEVNGTNPDSPWHGNVWSFTTGDFFVIDDFEDYNADENQIWYSWHDGLGYGATGTANYYAGNGTGASVGDETTASYTEETIVHGGGKSMPVNYDNNKQGYSKYSEVEYTLTDQRDWTAQGVTELSLWFRGYPASTGSFVEGPTGTFTMTASGSDIWAVNGVEADEFHFAYKTLSGAGSITAKVVSVSNTNAWAKAGVMIRETLNPDSAHAFACITPGNGVAMQYRPSTGGTSVNYNQTGVAAPYWVKVERSISGLFTVSQSANGTSWQPVTGAVAQTIPMATNVYIGLALTAHNAAATCQAVFSNVTTTGNVTGQWAHQDIGILSNDADPLYVAVSNSTGNPAVVVNDDPAAAQVDTWTEWVIPLSAFSDQGINLTSVDRIAIGLGTRGNMTVPGGSGKIFIDDIRLYQPMEDAGE